MARRKASQIEPGIQQLPDGRYRIRRYKPQREKTLPLGTTLQEARTALLRWRGVSTQPSRPAHDAAPTVADYAASWTLARRDVVRRSTLVVDLNILELHVLPYVGHLAAPSITRADVQAMVAAWAHERKRDGGSYSPRTINSWWRSARKMLRDLAADHRIPDPTERVRVAVVGTGGTPRERRTLSAVELGRLLEVVGQLFPDRHAEAVTLAYSGMRAGELYSLRWQDVDASRRVLSVCRSVSRGQINETKTGASREVVVPQVVIDALDEHRRRLVRDQHIGLATGLVFPSDVATPRTPTALREILRMCAESIGTDVRVTPQVLRRTYNTLCIEQGVDRLVLRAQMGHSSEAMTQRYAGIRIEQKAEAASAIHELLTGGTQ